MEAPSPTYWHQEVLVRIVVALHAWAKRQKRPVTVGIAPLDVRFGPGRILQPDAFVLLAAVPRAHKGPIDPVPELCIEVLAEDRVHDRVTQRLVCAAARVAEYWVVHPAALVERWSGRRLAQREELRQRLKTPLLPGFSFDLRKLFAVKA